MKNNPFKLLTSFELALWLFSMAAVTLGFVLFEGRDFLTLITSLVGLTALIFCAKGLPLGQMLIIAFGVLYGIISYGFHYYGEMITYLGMTAPIAVMSLVAWVRHPYDSTGEVEVSKLTRAKVAVMLLLSAAVTAVLHFVLRFFGTENLLFSTLSVTTSFIASYLTLLRSPYYALAYALNDAVLIVLWIYASTKSVSYVPMIICFAMFLINDVYGFVNWLRMRKRQTE